MTISLSLPGKTFLCGEYAALSGGPCILLATEPRFFLRARPSKKMEHPFHPESPAGRYLARHSQNLPPWSFEFENPYGGGFGASTAEFLLAQAFFQLQDTLTTEAQLDLDIKATLSEFRELHENHACPPSGAEIVGQACGFMTVFERKTGRIQVFGWPFPNLGWMLFSTGRKVPTHDHLASLKAFDFTELGAPVHRVWEALTREEEGNFVVGLHEFYSSLIGKGLQAQETLEITRRINQWPGVRICKGCGALGADVIFLLYDNREATEEDLRRAAEALGLTYRASHRNLTSGLRKEMPTEVAREMTP